MYFYYEVFQPYDADMLLSYLHKSPVFLGAIEQDAAIRLFFRDKPANSFETFLVSQGYNFEKGYVKETVEDWLAKFREGFKPFQVTQNLTIVPAWQNKNGECKQKCIYIYPGQAFGTGQHFTTSSVLELMETVDFKDKHVLDFGCGTGILSIYAEKLGAADIVAIDIDPAAVYEAQRHISLNAATKIVPLCCDITAIRGNYDVILGNIVFDVLYGKLHEIKTHLKENGIFIFSGIIQQKKTQFLEALKNYGFVLKKLKEDKEWVSGLSIID